MVKRFEQFSQSVSVLYQGIQKIEREEMEKLGLKGPFAQYLVQMIKHPEGITAAKAAELCYKDKAAVSRAMSEMEDLGLIKKEGNGYRALLFLTGKGKKAAEFVQKRAVAAVEKAGADLSEEERLSFYASLSKIAARVKDLSEKGVPESEGEI